MTKFVALGRTSGGELLPLAVDSTGRLAVNNHEDEWTAVQSLIRNTIDDTTLSYSSDLVGGVRRIKINWTDCTVYINNIAYDLAGGTVILNNADVATPTSYYIYAHLSGNSIVVSASTLSPESDPSVNYDYAWLSITRIKSSGGSAIVYYVRNAYCGIDLLLHYIGEYDLPLTPLWVSGGGITIDATDGTIDMAELEYRRLRFDREIDAITNGALLIETENTAYANIELIATYSDGSAITANRYHKILLGVIAAQTPTYPFIVVRQGKPGTEYTTLEEARIDSENVAATSFPTSYRGSVMPLAYIIMKVGDASDLTTVDLRATGVIGSGGGGGVPITDHHLLVNTNDPSDHLYAALIDGTRAFTGNIDMGTNDITNVGDVDGVDISAHVADVDAHHDRVTLDANADTILSLSTQQIGLDTQTANTVLCGPVTGAAAIPTFRALTATDLAYPNAPYGMYSDSTTQSIANIANAQVLTFNTNVYTSGLTRTSASRYTITQAGTYLITFSGIANLAQTPANKHLEVWLNVNGTPVAASNTRVELPNVSSESTVAVSFIQKFTAGQYFELWTWGDDTDCQWLATAAGINPTRPSVPSVIMTVNMISAN